MTVQEKIPVTVLTGFLGSGKTTLLNYILKENHGKRIAVIENEFGEIGIDNEIVIDADEEIFEMNNGCICCTVRGDLIRILSKLMKRKDKFDYIMVETTGLADPSPVAQTFFVDDELQENFSLDGIVTVVDALHVWQHIEDSDQCHEQIAFADVILLNKTDLVTPEELQKLEQKIRSINAMTKIFRTQNAEIDVANVLNVKSFDLDAKVELNPEFLKEEFPFEYSGIYDFQSGAYEFDFEAGPDETLDLAIFKIEQDSFKEIEVLEKKATLLFSETPLIYKQEDELILDGSLMRLSLGQLGGTFHLEINDPGQYIIFTQHLPIEFDMLITHNGKTISSMTETEYKASHEHDNSITSVGIDLVADLDEKKFNSWLSFLLREKGTDIFRMKGIISFKDQPDRFIFQGVHMLFDGKPDRSWKNSEARRNQIVFIGRNLNRKELNEGFQACLAQ